MWIFLDDSLLSAEVSSSKVKEGLDSLLHSIANGNHALTANTTKILKHLLQANLSDQYKSVLLFTLTRHAEIQSEAASSAYKIIIIHHDDAIIEAASDRSWKISLRWLAENEFPKSSLLSENERDFYLFYQSSIHFKSKIKFSRNVFICSLHGGGADTPKVYDSQLRSRINFVFCITDSDKRSPLMKPKSTSEKCNKLYINNKNDWVTMFYSLPVREIENLIPKNLISDALAFENNPSCLDRYEQLNKIQIEFPVAWLYFDLKEGTTIKSIQGACKDFWQPISKNALISKNIKPSCQNEFTCKKDACECLIAPSISKNLVDTIINYIKSPEKTYKSQAEIIKRVLSSDNSENWLNLGEKITSWGAAFEKTRS